MVVLVSGMNSLSLVGGISFSTLFPGLPSCRLSFVLDLITTHLLNYSFCSKFSIFLLLVTNIACNTL